MRRMLDVGCDNNTSLTIVDILCIINDNNDLSLINTPISTITISDVEDINLLTEALDVGCSSFVVQVTNPEYWITSTLMLALRKSLQRRDRKILILPDNKIQIQNSSEWAQFLSHDQLSFFNEIVVVTFNDKDPNLFDLLTNKFNGENDWNTIIKIDQWKDGSFLKGKNLYPDKVSNLNGKHVTISCFNYPSYVILQPFNENIHDPSLGDVLSVRGKDYKLKEGTELRLLFEWIQMFNGTSVILDTWQGEWGEIFENGTGNGVLGAVYDDRADIGFTALYLWWTVWIDLDFVMPNARTGVTVLVPKPRPLPMWLSPILPFNGTMWTAVGLIYLISSFACSFFSRFVLIISGIVKRRKGEITLRADGSPPKLSWTRPPFWEISDSFTRMLALFVSQGPGVGTKWLHPSTNGFLITLMLMLLLITSGYSSGLASILTLPRFEPPVDTLGELAHSKFQWAATHDAWVFSIRLAQDTNTKTVYNKFQVMTADQLRFAGKTGKIGFSIERLSGGNFAIQDYITEESISMLRLMSKDIYFEYVVFVTRKSSPYTESLNWITLRLYESGILLHWEGDVVRRFLPTGVQIAVSSSQIIENKVIKLGEEHILGTVFLLAFGLGGSLLIFLGELIYAAIHQQKKR